MYLQQINNSNNTNFKAMLGITETGNLSRKTKAHAKLKKMIQDSEAIKEFGKEYDFNAQLNCKKYTVEGNAAEKLYRYSLKFLPTSDTNNIQQGNKVEGLKTSFDVIDTYVCTGKTKDDVYREFRDMLEGLSLENIISSLRSEIALKKRVEELVCEKREAELKECKHLHSAMKELE